MTKEKERVKEIEARIADLKARWPAHSVPPVMLMELDELEEELELARRRATQQEGAANDKSGSQGPASARTG